MANRFAFDTTTTTSSVPISSGTPRSHSKQSLVPSRPCFLARPVAPTSLRHRVSRKGKPIVTTSSGVPNDEGDFVPVTIDRGLWNKVVFTFAHPPDETDYPCQSCLTDGFSLGGPDDILNEASKNFFNFQKTKDVWELVDCVASLNEVGEL